MVLSLFILVLIFLVIIFCHYKKALHLYEILFIWMTVWLITHSVSSILIVNLELFDLSTNKSGFWTHFFKRFLLYPLLIIIFFDFYVKIKNHLGKYTILLISIFTMSAVEFLFIHLGILKNKNFHIFDSLLEWTFTIMLTFILWLWYRNNRLKRS